MTDTPLLDRGAVARERHRGIRRACIEAGFPELEVLEFFLNSKMSPAEVSAHLKIANGAIARRRAGIPAPNLTTH